MTLHDETDDAYASIADLRAFVERVLRALAVSADDARVVADVVVAADARGMESHGIARLEALYVEPLRRGTIAVAAREVTLAESSTTLAVDARNGLGHPVSARTMARAIEKARASGVGIATVRGSNHHGISAAYARLALAHGFVGVAATNTPRIMAPTFGRDALLGTNPLAIAAPAAGGEPFVFDMATSAISFGALERAARRGERLEGDVAVDADGRPTRDPFAAMAGALLPSGGHKGYGLNLALEIATGILAGGAFGSAMPTRRDVHDPPGATSHLFVALDVARFRDPDDFARDVARLQATLRASRPADGRDRVATPGDGARDVARERERTGIPLDAAVRQSLARLAERHAVAPPVLRRRASG